MAAYYADSSTLVKRHIPESGSAWFKALLAATAGHIFLTAQLSLVEVYSALNRRVREAAITPADYQRLTAKLLHVWSVDYEIINLTPLIIDDARTLLERYPLRAYDAVQLASALQARRMLLTASAAAPIFLAADNRLLVAARAEGFVTDNPNSH